MGIITDPGYILYGSNCVHAFPSGFAPKKLYASVSGITGPFGVPPWYPPPPSGIYLMEQVPGQPCRWRYLNDGFLVQLDFAASETTFSVSEDDFYYFFTANRDAIQLSFTNDDIPDIYRGGQAFVSPRPTGTGFASITDVAELLVIERTKKTFAEVFPCTTEDEAVYKFNRKSDKTNVLVKVDLSAF